MLGPLLGRCFVTPQEGAEGWAAKRGNPSLSRRRTTPPRPWRQPSRSRRHCSGAGRAARPGPRVALPPVRVEVCSALGAFGGVHAPHLQLHLLACYRTQLVVGERCLAQEVNPIQIAPGGLHAQVEDLEPRLLQVVALLRRDRLRATSQDLPTEQHGRLSPFLIIGIACERAVCPPLGHRPGPRYEYPGQTRPLPIPLAWPPRRAAPPF